MNSALAIAKVSIRTIYRKYHRSGSFSQQCMGRDEKPENLACEHHNRTAISQKYLGKMHYYCTVPLSHDLQTLLNILQATSLEEQGQYQYKERIAMLFRLLLLETIFTL